MKNLEKNINIVINKFVDSGRVVGTSIIIAQHGHVIFEQQAGWADRDQGKRVTDQTLFRLASMTKPIVSAAAMALLEKGVLDLDSPITKWLPKFNPKNADGKVVAITIRQLLTHTAGFTYGFLSVDNEPYRSAGVSDGLDETVLSLDENLKRLANVPLLFEPGSSWCYSLATDVLGAVIEAASQQSLSNIVEQYVTGPLKMKDTSFSVVDSQRLTQAYADSPNGEAARLMQAKDQVLLEGCGPIHYVPNRIHNKQAYFSGGSGMVGTARDYLIFLETIRCGGYPILTKNSVNLLTQDAIQHLEEIAAGPGYGFGMGFAVVRDAIAAGTPRNSGSYDWGGVYGTKMLVDPQASLSAVMLTNTALEGLTGTFSNKITQAIYDAI